MYTHTPHIHTHCIHTPIPHTDTHTINTPTHTIYPCTYPLTHYIHTHSTYGQSPKSSTWAPSTGGAPLHGTWVDSTASVDPVSTRLHSRKPQASLPSGGVRCEGTLRQGKLRGQDGRGLTPWPLNPQDGLVSKAVPLPEAKALPWRWGPLLQLQGPLPPGTPCSCPWACRAVALGGRQSRVSPLTPTCPCLSNSPCAMALAVPCLTPAYKALTVGVHTEPQTHRLE